jgi:lipopolysaccharide/colanic/teichoic acid biosynthesis glycosyltransferase
MSVAQQTSRNPRAHLTVRPRFHPAAVPPAPQAPDPQQLAPGGYLRWKAVLDWLLAVLLLAPGLLIIGLLVLLVRLTSRGPGLFRQTRVGRGGRIFTMFKIRTMTHNAEAATGAVWCQIDDVRVTSVGKVLRRFHLDELPQLLNVIKGEMSLVGPRPERPEFVHVLAETIPRYLQRLRVRPGITGLAQLNLPPDSNLESVERKLALDLEYIERAGPLLDVRLLLGTAMRLVKVPEPWLLGALRLYCKVPTPTKTHANGAKKTNGKSHVPLPGFPAEAGGAVDSTASECQRKANPAREPSYRPTQPR